MNIANLIAALVAPYISGLVTLARISEPTADSAALALFVEGLLKHFLRSKLGFVVDILWDMSDFKNALDSAISAAVANISPLDFPPAVAQTASTASPSATTGATT